MTLPVLQFRVSRNCCPKPTKSEDNGTFLVPSNDRPNHNGNLKNQKHFAGPAFKARPMKHYRKRLLPNNRVGSSRATIRSFDVPGGVSYNNDGNYCDKNGLVHLNEKI